MDKRNIDTGGRVNLKDLHSVYSAMELNLLIAQGMEAEEMGRLVVTAIPSLVEVPLAALGFLDKNGNWLVVGQRDKCLLDAAVAEELASFLADDLAEQVFGSIGSLWLADVPSAAGMVPEPLAKLGVRSLLVIPVRTISNSFGVMMVGKEVAQDYTLNQRLLVSTVVNQMAIALENRRLYEISQQEIAERKQAEKDFENIFNLSPDMVGVFTTEGGLIRVNSSWETILGYKTEELLEMDWTTLVHPDDVERTNKEVEKQLEGSVVVGFINRYKCKDGSYKALEWRATFAKEGIVHATARDITERKQAEESLRLQAEIIANMSEGVYIIRANDGVIVYTNPKFEEMFGYELGEMVGKHVSIVNAPTEKNPEETAKEIIESINKTGGWRGEIQNIKKDGTLFWSYANVSIFNHPEYGRVWITVHTDITERKRADEALRESEQNFRNSVDDSPLGITIASIDRKLVYANQAFLDIYGYSSIEKLRAVPMEQRFTPQAYAVRQERRKLGKSFLSKHEISIVRKDGEIRYLVVFRKVVIWGGEKRIQSLYQDITERKQAEEALRESEERYRALVNLGAEIGEAVIMLQDTEQGDAIQTFVSDGWLHITGYSKKALLGMSLLDLLHPRHRQAALERHQRKMSGETIPDLFEMSIIRKDGIEIPIELTSAHTTYQGKRANVAYIRDITERKQAEEREKELQRELYHSSRLASIGELAAGVAHEINNPLTGIMGFTQRLLRKSTDDKISRDLERIHSEALRVARVVENLRTFARRSGPKKKYSDINEILSRTLELGAYELRTNNIELAVELTPDLPKAMVDFQQLQQVFLNIVLNAEQAMTEANNGGKLTIKTQLTKDYIRVSFTDDGPGILAEQLDRVFDPFFTTREERGGTGLGLSLCHGIVTEHGGRIYARSKPGKGATFVVELPLATQEINKSKVVEKQPVRRGRVFEES